ncbi:hypothetical protein SDC9_142336 [bioreactor metagenome]|uniref:Uncharacterized protein n=1 Tax=bioreactor metagenome TaxID=1076179 RepID=A0A645E2Z2_9ZZZZ
MLFIGFIQFLKSRFLNRNHIRFCLQRRLRATLFVLPFDWRKHFPLIRQHDLSDFFDGVHGEHLHDFTLQDAFHFELERDQTDVCVQIRYSDIDIKMFFIINQMNFRRKDIDHFPQHGRHSCCGRTHHLIHCFTDRTQFQFR